jgi:acyl-ACP thioesterase
VWVVRRTTLRLVEGGRWPRYLDRVTLTTWCGGSGAAWAERRTNFDLDGVACLEVAALWVPLSPDGHPVRMRENFFEVYGEAARSRKVPGRVSTPAIPSGSSTRPWPLRNADLDIIGHVNNAAIWQAVSEVAVAPVRWVSVTHHQAIEREDVVTLFATSQGIWLVVDGVVKVSAQFVTA